MSTTSDLAHKRALTFMHMYGRGDDSKTIAKEMGWETQFPSHMVQNFKSRLKKRGYDVPVRGSRK